MKKSILSLLTLALILTVALVSMTEAKKAAPKLACTIEYWWMPGWEGTISGDIEGDAVWPAGATPPKFVGQTSHYEGRFEIYNSLGELILAGEGAGSTTIRHGRNSVWRSNGTVTDAGVGWEDWIGRHVYQDGHFTWQNIGTPEDPIIIPEHGTGTFRVN